LHLGAGILPMMEDAEHFDRASSGLVIVNDVLLYVDATAFGEEIASGPGPPVGDREAH
jgi:hypothetical protein